MNTMIKVQGLSKNYGDFALQNVSFSLPGGAIMGFVGENGAGKTTTLKCLLGLVHPDSGEALIFGQPLSTAAKSDIGVVFDESYFHDNLTLKNVDTIMSKIYTNWDSAYFAALCKKFGLPQNKVVKQFSRGMKMKLSITAALAHHPRLLILDEATSGLDPIVRDEILDLFLDFIRDEEHSILFSSHITSDLEKIADYVTLIHGGKILFSENKDTLIYSYGVARCTTVQAAKIAAHDVLAQRKTAMGTEFLLSEREAFCRRYPEIVVDRVGIEDIMLFYVKGVC
ncbi:MAG: ABC transporter ATP-binding protein [Pygmaiobacter sp.]